MADLAQPRPFFTARSRWKALTLARQFVLAGAVTVLAGMAIIGVWVTRQIEEGVTTNTASATALYVDSVIAPLLSGLSQSDTLTSGARRALDEILTRGPLGNRIVTFKIWKAGGLIAYSSRPELIGKRFPPTGNLREAWAGHVAAEYDELDDDEDATERAENIPLLEIYSPIREPWSGKVIAVAEFYENAAEIEDNIAEARLVSWLVVGAVTLGTIGLLSLIVFGGSRLITSQSRALQQRIAELSALLKQNEELRVRVQGASARATALNERFLRRVGADLHDGPAQLLALASLRMSSISAQVPATQGEDAATVRQCLDEAMQEIRNISRGVALPQIEGMTFDDLVAAAARAHESRTGTKVALSLPDPGPLQLTGAEKICIFRFVQEGLNNAYKHASGIGQRIVSTFATGELCVSVADSGPGILMTADGTDGLGLGGLRDRVEALGGRFKVASDAGGTKVSMIIRPSEGHRA